MDDVVWRNLASIILRKTDNLGLDATLFLLDSRLVRLDGLPSFYQGLGLLEEPLIHGSRLDVQDRTAPGLTHR